MTAGIDLAFSRNIRPRPREQDFTMTEGSMKPHSKANPFLRVVAALAALALIYSDARSEGLLDKAKANGELVLGTEMQYAPFEFLDNDTPKGYSIDLMKLVAADLGVKTRY